MAKQPRTQAASEAGAPAVEEPAVVAASDTVVQSGLLARLDLLARSLEGADHVRHEAMLALTARLAGLKHHLARLDAEHFEASVNADLAAIAKLL